MSWYQNAKYKAPPFSYEIRAIKEDFDAVFFPDKGIAELYEEHIKIRSDPEFIRDFPNAKIKSYEEFYTFHVFTLLIHIQFLSRRDSF